MKKRHNILLLAGVFLLLAAGCKKPSYNTFVDQGTLVFTSSASAPQLVIPGNSNGTATLSATFDANNKVFNYTATWAKMDSTITSIVIYGPNAAGQPYVITRTLATFSAPLPTGAAGSYQWTIFQLSALSDFEVSNLKSGNCYFVVNTTASPTGSVRGQIKYVNTIYEDN